MKRLACAAAGLALLAGVAVAADPTIKEIMTKAHKGGTSLLANMGKELKEDEPDWNDVDIRKLAALPEGRVYLLGTGGRFAPGLEHFPDRPRLIDIRDRVSQHGGHTRTVV